MRLIELLLRKRADPLAANKQGKTPIDLAKGEALAALQQKLAAGADDAKAAAAGEAAAEGAAAAGDVAGPALAPEAAPGGAASAEAPPQASEPTHATLKRGGAAAVADTTAADDAGAAKRPKVTLSFDDGEGGDDGDA